MKRGCMLTTKQAADRLGVSERRVQALVKSGVLEARKLSGVWAISEASVEHRLANVNKAGGRPRKGSGRAEAPFLLMNRMHEVTRLVYDARRKAFTKIGSDIDSRYAPIGLSAKGAISLEAFNAWWRGRGIPQTRIGLSALLDEAGVSLPQELVQRNLGLSLSDHYWIKPESFSLAWETVNFFNNDFDQVSLATAPFAPEARAAVAKPDNTSDGNLEKRWVCRDGLRVLLKGGTRYGQEPYNEAVATALHRRLLAPGDYVAYAVEGEGATALSCCADFLTDEEEYVPALYVERALDCDGRATDFEHFLACCESLGVEGEQRALDRMIVCDDIIANHDRHRRNFGIVRNVETGTCRPAPLFDSGSSLWCDVATSRLAAGEHSFASKQFYESPAKQLLLVDDMSWVDLAALDGFVDEAMAILAANEALAARLPHIRSALEWRVERMANIIEWS